MEPARGTYLVDGKVIRYEGEVLGIEEGRRLGVLLEQMVGETSDVVVIELPFVRHLSSVALGAIIRAWRIKQRTGGRVVVEASGPVRERLERAGFSTLLAESSSKAGSGGGAVVEFRPPPKKGLSLSVSKRDRGHSSPVRLLRFLLDFFRLPLGALWRLRRRRSRKDEIIALWEKGMRQAEIARRLGVSRQRVHTVVKKYRARENAETETPGKP